MKHTLLGAFDVAIHARPADLSEETEKAMVAARIEQALRLGIRDGCRVKCDASGVTFSWVKVG